MKNVIILFSFLLLCCCKHKEQINDTVQNTSKVSDQYEEIQVEKAKILEDSKSIVYELKTSYLKNIFLTLDVQKEVATLEIDQQKITTAFNFSYDTTPEDAIKEIKLLMKDNSYIFLLPVATEEYLTFQLLKYDGLNRTFFESYFHFATHQNIIQLYLQSKPILVERNQSYNLNIADYAFKGVFKPLNNETSQSFEENENKSLKTANSDTDNKNNNSFVVSCGSGCAMTYVADKIETKSSGIQVYFTIDMYVDEKITDNYTESYLFKFDESNNIHEIISEETNENVLNTLPIGAKESFIEFSKKLTLNK